jgi:hypothetical protein
VCATGVAEFFTKALHVVVLMMFQHKIIKPPV